MMQVLFLPKWYPNRLDPFDGNFVENHAHAIKKVARVFVLFVHSDQLTKKNYETIQTDNQGIQECRVYFKKAETPFTIINKLINFIRFKKAQKLGYGLLFPKSKPDLCHIHVLSRTALLAMALKRKYQIPFVVSEHWSGYLPHSGEYKGLIKRWYTEKVVKNANAVHTVTTQLASAMKSHRLNNRYTVIPNVVDVDLFKPLAQKAKDNIQILFVGNLLQRPKKLFDILKGIASLSKKRQDFILQIYGEGSDELEAKALVKALDIKQFVNFNGTTDRKGIGKVMAESDFLILFSEFENQPCVISEAQACGLPVVVPQLEGIAEFMSDELGLMVEHLNQSDFELKLEQMCDEYRKYTPSVIREYAVNTFGENQIARSFESFYQASLS